MSLSFYQRRKILKGANYLELTPVRSIKETISEDKSIVTLLIPKFTNKIAVKYFLPMLKKKEIKMKLDEYGSAAWLFIDGKRRVADINNELVKKFGEEIQPVEERVTRYLTLLYEQRFISFKELISKGA